MPTLTSTSNAPVISAVAANAMLLMLANRASLRGHPALWNLGALGNFGPHQSSLAAQFPLFGLDGYDLLSSVSEGSAVTETSLTMALKTCTVARRSLRRDISDQMRTIDASGALSIPRLALDGFNSANKSLTNLIAALGAGFSTVVGTSGVDFDHDVFLDAKAALIEAKVPGPYLMVIPEHFFAEWMKDLESRGGITQWRPATAEMQMLRGPGYQGSYDGVDIFTSDGCATSGSDKQGGMWGAGAVGYAEMELEFPASAFIQLKAGPIAVEEVREGTKGVTDVVTHYMVGVTEIEDARGVQILALGS